MRTRDLGITIGLGRPGPLNAITDVPGVRVGHATIIDGDGPLVVGRGPHRTGVTVVVPRGPHHRGTRSASVKAFQTSSRGASKVRSKTRSPPSE